jgi:hypothetical protein
MKTSELDRRESFSLTGKGLGFTGFSSSRLGAFLKDPWATNKNIEGLLSNGRSKFRFPEAKRLLTRFYGGPHNQLG